MTTDQAACDPLALAEVLPAAGHVTGTGEQHRLERDVPRPQPSRLLRAWVERTERLQAG